MGESPQENYNSKLKRLEATIIDQKNCEENSRLLDYKLASNGGKNSVQPYRHNFSFFSDETFTFNCIAFKRGAGERR